MITFLPHDLPKRKSIVPVTHHTCLPSVQGYQEASDHYRRNTTLSNKRFSDPGISLTKQNCLIIVNFPIQSAPSSEFPCLDEPFSDIVNTALLDVGLS